MRVSTNMPHHAVMELRYIPWYAREVGYTGCGLPGESHGLLQPFGQGR